MKSLNHLASLVVSAVATCALLAGASGALAQDAATAARGPSVPLAPDAPSTYVVQRGDTLWDISSRFLTQPWYWPEIWHLNPAIQNPHLIYPGDTLRLVYGADGRPQIHVQRGNTVVLGPQVRTSPIDQSIPAIPYEIVAAFLSRPTVLDREEAAALPYVVAQSQDRVIAAMGDGIYGKRVEAPTGSRYSVVRLGDRLTDPDDGYVLGWAGIYSGIARVEDRARGDGEDRVTRLTLVESTRETLVGDRLIRESLDVPLDFVPSAPSQPVDGRIMAVGDGVSIIGQYQVVILNRGTRHGLQPGNVLSVWNPGAKVRDPGTTTGWTRGLGQPFAGRVRLPDERSGTVMVFRTFDRMSYGLVVEANDAMRLGDAVRNPELSR